MIDTDTSNERHGLAERAPSLGWEASRVRHSTRDEFLAPGPSELKADRVITRCTTRSMSVPGATVRAVPGDPRLLPAPVSAAAPGAGLAVLAGAHAKGGAAGGEVSVNGGL